MNWTLADIEKKEKEGKIRGIVGALKIEPSKKSKYGNKKTEVDGIVFDSKKEANRWKFLRVLLKAGAIAFLERQVEYELNPGGTHSLKYRCDFRYMISGTGEMVVEDVKGMRTKIYLKKKKLMKKVHGIEIKEV